MFKSNREQTAAGGGAAAVAALESAAVHARGNRGARAVRSWRGAEMTSPGAEQTVQKTPQRACPEPPASASSVCSGTMFSPKIHIYILK